MYSSPSSEESDSNSGFLSRREEVDSEFERLDEVDFARLEEVDFG